MKRRQLYPFIGESVIRQGDATKKPNAEWKGIVSAGVMKILNDEGSLTVALREHCSQELSSQAADDDDSIGSDKLRRMLSVAAELVARNNCGADDLIVSIVKINYGMKDKDPVHASLFYDQERDENGRCNTSVHPSTST